MSHGFVQLPPDSTGKKLHTNITDTGEHNQVFCLGDEADPDRLQKVDQYGSAQVKYSTGNPTFDAFGKNKVSQETAIGSYMPTYDTIPTLVQTAITGTASETHLPLEASIKFITGADLGDRIVRTTNKYHKYYPGTSQTILMTASIGDFGKDGVTRRWGYYDDEDGLFFQIKGTAFQVVQRSSVSGSVVDTEVEQVDFNGDKADGTGLSDMLADPSKANIYWIDFQWLGVGRVRFGMVNDQGEKILIHAIENPNAHPTVYMGTGSLPLRWEQFNHAAPISGSEMKVINGIVFTDSQNIESRGKCFSSATFGPFPSPKTLKADGTFDSIISVRPKATVSGKVNRTISIPQHLMVSTDKPLQLSIMRDVNNGTPTWGQANNINSAMEVAGGLTFVDVNGGNSVYCMLIDSGVHEYTLLDSFSYFRECLYLNADGSQPTYTIICRTLDGTTAEVIAGMTWTELII